MLNGKVIIINLIVGLMKKTLYKMSKHFPKPYEPFGGDINIKVDLSNYATKADIKDITHVDTPRSVLKTNLASIKTKVDKLDIDKLVPVPLDLRKLTNIVKNEVVTKTEYNAKIKNIEDKIPDISNLTTKNIINTKINEVNNKILSISNLATTSALTAVENKIPSVSNLVKKTDYNAKVSDIEKKITDHIITAADNKPSSIHRKIVSNKTKAFDSSYYNGKNYFDENGIQNNLVFQSILKYFTLNSSWITKWKSKGLSNESVEVVSTSSNTLTPSVNYYGEKARLKFTGSILKQKILTYSHKKFENLYVVYEITNFHGIDNYPTQANNYLESLN